MLEVTHIFSDFSSVEFSVQFKKSVEYQKNQNQINRKSEIIQTVQLK